MEQIKADIAVIGTGAAGMTAAIRAAQLGAKKVDAKAFIVASAAFNSDAEMIRKYGHRSYHPHAEAGCRLELAHEAPVDDDY
jgi:glycine/D-amino acid oxidase-like deaminating enzyme